MAGMTEKLTGQHVLDADLADWRLMVRALHAHFATGDFATGIRFAERISAAAEEMNHHPDIDLRYPHVAVRLTSHDTGGVTERDVELARRISAAAADLGVAAEPSRVSLWELALDTAHEEAIGPFWEAVLGLRAAGLRRRRRARRPGGRAAHALVPGRPSRTTSPGSASTSTCGCRTTSPSSGSPTRWRPAGRWSATPRRRRSGCSRTRRQQGVHLHLAGPRLTASRLAGFPGRPGKPVLVGHCSARRAQEAPVRSAGNRAIPGSRRTRTGRPGRSRCGTPSQHLGSVTDWLDAGTPRRRT